VVVDIELVAETVIPVVTGWIKYVSTVMPRMNREKR
jgi:hypothetical protein